MFKIGFCQHVVVFQTAINVTGHQVNADMMIELHCQSNEFLEIIDLAEILFLSLTFLKLFRRFGFLSFQLFFYFFQLGKVAYGIFLPLIVLGLCGPLLVFFFCVGLGVLFTQCLISFKKSIIRRRSSENTFKINGLGDFHGIIRIIYVYRQECQDNKPHPFTGFSQWGSM